MVERKKEKKCVDLLEKLYTPAAKTTLLETNLFEKETNLYDSVSDHQNTVLFIFFNRRFISNPKEFVTKACEHNIQ